MFAVLVPVSILLAFGFIHDKKCEDTKLIVRTAAGKPYLQTLRQGGQMLCEQPADVGLPRVLAWNCNNDHVLQMPAVIVGSRMLSLA